MQNHNTLVILAGGASSRMKRKSESASLTLTQKEVQQAQTRSKGLIEIGTLQRPLLDYVLCNAKKAGITDILLIIGEKGALFHDFYGQKHKGNLYNGMTISYAIQRIPKHRVKPWGTADALQQAMEQYPELKERIFLVCNSDNLYSAEALSALIKVPVANALVTYDRDALEFPKERIEHFALVKISREGYLSNIIEKPNKSNYESYRDGKGKLRVSMNAFKFSGQDIYPFLVSCLVNQERDEKELPTAVLSMILKSQVRVKAIPLAEHVPDLTSKQDIVAVKKYISDSHFQLDW